MTPRLTFKWLAILLLVMCVLPAQSMPAEQYLKLRRQKSYDPRISLSAVQQDSSLFNGKVMELKGYVSGTVSRDLNVSFLLVTDEESSILLNAPVDDVQLVRSANRQMLRVLVKVSPAITGNTVPLEVLALTEDFEITDREKSAAEQEALAAKRAAAIKVQQDLARKAVQTRSPGAERVVPIKPGGAISDMARRYLSLEAQAIYPQYRGFIQNCNRHLTSKDLDTITVSVLHFSQRFKVDPRLVISLIIAESDFDPKSTSHAGAMGLGQLMPDEVQALKLGNPYDPVWNIKGAVDLLKGKLDRYKQPGGSKEELTWRQIELALAAYNAGPGAVRKYGGVPPYKETQNYVKRVIRTYKSLCGQG